MAENYEFRWQGKMPMLITVFMESYHAGLVFHHAGVQFNYAGEHSDPLED